MEHLKIIAVKPLNEFHLELSYSNNEKTVIDFSGKLKGIWEILKDLNRFQEVNICAGGRGIAWSDELDCCADALWLEAHPEQYKVYLEENKYPIPLLKPDQVSRNISQITRHE